mmetsp:Transcript_1574/g.4225  ORF Transcript_1574/g.4225 Transcript_1574/m.4225 type:complete len:111 (-) Transcript_1574:78-410(-)
MAALDMNVAELHVRVVVLCMHVVVLRMCVAVQLSASRTAVCSTLPILVCRKDCNRRLLWTIHAVLGCGQAAPYVLHAWNVWDGLTQACSAGLEFAAKSRAPAWFQKGAAI